jgi:hypothetical protein
MLAMATLFVVVTSFTVLGIPVTGGQSQQRDLTPDELTRIIRSGNEDDLQLPEIIAGLYGQRAKRALESLLEGSSTREAFLLQLSALTVAQYPRVGIRLELLKEYATGSRLNGLPDGLRQILRVRALKALSTQPDPALRDFWLQLRSHPARLYRQFVPFGLACAIGPVAIADLEQLRQDTDTVLRRQAERVIYDFSVDGLGARVCGGATRDEAPKFPTELRPALIRRSEQIRRAIP